MAADVLFSRISGLSSRFICKHCNYFGGFHAVRASIILETYAAVDFIVCLNQIFL